MYGGKHVTEGDTIFVFASENEGGHGPHRDAAVVSVGQAGREEARHCPRNRRG